MCNFIGNCWILFFCCIFINLEMYALPPDTPLMTQNGTEAIQSYGRLNVVCYLCMI
jgi:hypothetical protein